MTGRRYSREELQTELQRWNQHYPVGTQVKSDVYPDAVHKTRTEAVPLFGQKPVIYLEGFNGYFDLHEIHPLGAEIADSKTGSAASNDASASPVPIDAGGDKDAAIGETTVANAVTVPQATREYLAILFPGQGAQSKGMGKHLFGAYPEQVRAADAILGYSIEDLCINDPDSLLNQTAYTQPALYIVNALNYLRMQEDGSIDGDIDFLAGHSLGEYNALLAAGVFDFETGLRLVVERGRLMSQASGGGMAAVVGIHAQSLRTSLDEAGLQSIDLANFNSPSQIVISGPAADIDRAIDELRKQKATVVPLKVSAAFHSRYMADAQKEFADFMKSYEFSEPRIPVIANASAQPYVPSEIAETLSRQISSPVLWNDSIGMLAGKGDVRFVEVGSRILTRMVNEIKAAYAV